MVTVPVKVTFSGSRHHGEQLRGQANRVMFVLEKQMSLRGLDQLTMTVETPDGSTITCSKVFDRRMIKIATSGGRGKEDWSERKCVCNCNFSEGYILKVEDDKLDKDDTDLTPLYTIMACVNGGKRYKLFQHVLASDFTKYTKGQKILLVSYYQMAFLCCEGTALPANGCKPKKSDLDVSDENWRSTYRIIPWCALRIPRWYKVRSSQNGDVR